MNIVLSFSEEEKELSPDNTLLIFNHIKNAKKVSLSLSRKVCHQLITLDDRESLVGGIFIDGCLSID